MTFLDCLISVDRYLEAACPKQLDRYLYAACLSQQGGDRKDEKKTPSSGLGKPGDRIYEVTESMR